MEACITPLTVSSILPLFHKIGKWVERGTRTIHAESSGKCRKIGASERGRVWEKGSQTAAAAALAKQLLQPYPARAGLLLPPPTHPFSLSPPFFKILQGASQDSRRETSAPKCLRYTTSAPDSYKSWVTPQKPGNWNQLGIDSVSVIYSKYSLK